MLPNRDHSEVKSSPKNVVIIGAGPIGLAHAWGIKKINPNVNVVVLEKYEKYQRSHTLIMEHQALSALMHATGTQADPELNQLQARLKKNHHIRTNELEEIFKKLAADSGVKIEYEELEEATLEAQLEKHKPDFIIGADGTHSTVSRCLFPKGNQVKIEFDFVLQFRYEIGGEQKPEQLNNAEFIQMMAKHGMIANEYVGRYDEKTQTTPVTMQMMISKEAFTKLTSASSKFPIKPFIEPKEQKEQKEQKELKDDKAETQIELKFDDLPANIRNFLNRYLTKRVAISKLAKDAIDPKSVRISVNEAPATYAKQPVHFWHGIPVALVGDASLGLSYFKGLNAGLRSAAKFFTMMSSIIKKQEFNVKRKIERAFAAYSDWFLKFFAPYKIEEVEQYSKWRIRAPMKLMQSAAQIKSISFREDLEGDDAILRNLFKFTGDPSYINEINSSKTLYPHRGHDLVESGQLSFVPYRYTLKKIAKLFIDYFKPYKFQSQGSEAAASQFFKGVANTTIGIGKLLAGIFTLSPKRFGDGFLNLLRGSLEIATFPLAYFIQPFTRGLTTLIKGMPKIEGNAGMRRLAHAGLDKLAEVGKKELNPKQKFDLLAISCDLHRKFKKANKRGQSSHLTPLDEQKAFCAAGANMDSEPSAIYQQLHNYFSFFADKRKLAKSQDVHSAPAPRPQTM